MVYHCIKVFYHAASFSGFTALKKKPPIPVIRSISQIDYLLEIGIKGLKYSKNHWFSQNYNLHIYCLKSVQGVESSQLTNDPNFYKRIHAKI